MLPHIERDTVYSRILTDKDLHDPVRQAEKME